eukprot:scaffold34756_cov28-Tisochrysis_lutea.AAC.1
MRPARPSLVNVERQGRRCARHPAGPARQPTPPACERTPSARPLQVSPRPAIPPPMHQSPSVRAWPDKDGRLPALDQHRHPQYGEQVGHEVPRRVPKEELRHLAHQLVALGDGVAHGAAAHECGGDCEARIGHAPGSWVARRRPTLLCPSAASYLAPEPRGENGVEHEDPREEAVCGFPEGPPKVCGPAEGTDGVVHVGEEPLDYEQPPECPRRQHAALVAEGRHRRERE